ncbi:MAG: peroxiredoxin [Chloroflexota bacterium]
MLKKGGKAPDFEAQLDSGTRVKLSDFMSKKNLVLYFYPKDFTSGCTKEACAFRDTRAEFEKRDAVIIGVSLDPEESHARFKGQYGLNFPLISDKNRELSRLFGVLRRIGPSVQRVTFVIDKKGIIRQVIHNELNMQAHIDQALEALNEIADQA